MSKLTATTFAAAIASANAAGKAREDAMKAHAKHATNYASIIDDEEAAQAFRHCYVATFMSARKGFGSYDSIMAVLEAGKGKVEKTPEFEKCRKSGMSMFWQYVKNNPAVIGEGDDTSKRGAGGKGDPNIRAISKALKAAKPAQMRKVLHLLKELGLIESEKLAA